jgi:succinoglycan biosynthesis transport protein ExoP
MENGITSHTSLTVGDRTHAGGSQQIDLASPRASDDATGRRAAAAAAAAASGRRITPLASIKAHKSLALAVMVGVFLVGAPILWYLTRPLYYTEAAIRVSPRFVKNLNEDQELEFTSNNQYREFVQQQVNTINRYDIVFDSLTKLGEKRALYQGKTESDRRAAERLAGELSIKSVPESYLITIGLQGKTMAGLAEIVNTVAETYLERAKSEEFFASDKRVEAIKAERKKLQEELETKFNERTALSQEIGVTTFTDSLLNPYDQLLIKSREALEDATRKRIEAESQLSSLEAGQKGSDKTAADAMAEEMAVKDAGLNSLKSNLYIRRSQLLAKLSGLAPEHPGRRSIERELNEIETEVARATKALAQTYRPMFLEQRRAEVARARSTEKELAAQVQNEASRATFFASRYHEALALGDEINRMRKRIATIDERIDFFALEANAPGFVRMVTPARTPEIPTKGNRRKLFALFLLGCVGLGLATPIALDYFDPRIRASHEIPKITGFPAIGWILDRNDEATHFFAQDQLIRLAARFDRERRENGTKILAFTSPGEGEGTTTLVLTLTQALIKLGVHAVAVEANLFNPDPLYQGDHASQGFVGMLEHGAMIDEIVVRGNEKLPDRIPVGGNAVRQPLATIPQLDRALSDLTREYDLVLIDTPPLRLSSDTELVIGQADACLMVILAQGESSSQIKRTVSMLERIAPPAVGVILNRVKAGFEEGNFEDVLRTHYTRKDRSESMGLSLRRRM